MRLLPIEAASYVSDDLRLLDLPNKLGSYQLLLVAIRGRNMNVAPAACGRGRERYHETVIG